jgi:hypothetical protein
MKSQPFTLVYVLAAIVATSSCNDSSKFDAAEVEHGVCETLIDCGRRAEITCVSAWVAAWGDEGSCWSTPGVLPSDCWTECRETLRAARSAADSQFNKTCSECSSDCDFDSKHNICSTDGFCANGGELQAEELRMLARTKSHASSALPWAIPCKCRHSCQRPRGFGTSGEHPRTRPAGDKTSLAARRRPPRLHAQTALARRHRGDSPDQTRAHRTLGRTRRGPEST